MGKDCFVKLFPDDQHFLLFEHFLGGAVHLFHCVHAFTSLLLSMFLRGSVSPWQAPHTPPTTDFYLLCWGGGANHPGLWMFLSEAPKAREGTLGRC